MPVIKQKNINYKYIIICACEINFGTQSFKTKAIKLGSLNAKFLI